MCVRALADMPLMTPGRMPASKRQHAHLPRVSARHDDDVVSRVSRVNSRLDARHGLGAAHDALAPHVAAALWPHLVLQQDACSHRRYP